MPTRAGVLMVIMGALLTFAFIHSTSIFDPQAFGVALMVAGAVSTVTELRDFAPRQRWAVAFAGPDTVLPQK